MNFLVEGRNESMRPLVKPMGKRNGGKIRPKPVAVEVALQITNKGPNMSRKSHKTKLYPFPSFDKCDSLLFFPSTFTSCLNSGDFVSLNKLMNSRIEKNCQVNLCDLVMDVTMLEKVFGCLNELRPDTIMCVHTTKVVGNQIRALIYFKYTDNKTLFERMQRTYPDKEVIAICAAPSSGPVKLQEFIDSKPVHERAALTNLVFGSNEVLIYGRTFMTLTFDDFTKTITKMDLACEFTSFGSI